MYVFLSLVKFYKLLHLVISKKNKNNIKEGAKKSEEIFKKLGSFRNIVHAHTVSSVILSEVAREKESPRNYDLKADKRDEDTVRFLDLQLIVCGKVNSRQFRGSILKIKKVESSFCVAFHCFIVSRKTVK